MPQPNFTKFFFLAIEDIRYYTRCLESAREKYEVYLDTIRLDCPEFPDYFEQGTQNEYEDACFLVSETKSLNIEKNEYIELLKIWK